VTWSLSGSNQPIIDWIYAGGSYRLSMVGGLLRFEQETRAGAWYLVQPDHDTTAMLVCAEELVNRLRKAETTIVKLKHGVGE
jgi:hypothetical protein